MPLQVRYTDASWFDAHPNAPILCIVGHDSDRPEAAPPDAPFARVAMRPLGHVAYEVWTGSGPVVYRQDGELACSTDGTVTFVVGSPTDPDSGVEAATRLLYRRVLDRMATGAHRKIWRFWNYLPAITEHTGETERYWQFNQGRQAAFGDAHPRPPAASALGTQGGSQWLLAISAEHSGTPVENPRQISAYAYPAQYGPASPKFSRALAVDGRLFISGTASILGHASLHPGDVRAQAAETILNLRTLFAQAAMVEEHRLDPEKREHDQPDFTGSGREFFSQIEIERYQPVLERADTALALKLYVRRAEDSALVEAVFREAFPDVREVALFQADICRPELLLEAEAYLWREPA